MPIQFTQAATAISGVQNLHIALITQNDKNVLKGDLPQFYDGVAALTPGVSPQTRTYNGNNRVVASDTTIQSATLQVQVPSITSELDENVLGSLRKGLATALNNKSGPDVLVKFEVTKSNGGSLFYQVAACSFAPAVHTAQTQGGNFQDIQLNATVVPPKNGSLGNVGYIVIDSDDPKVIAAGLSVADLRAKIFGTFLWFFKTTVLNATPAAPSITVAAGVNHTVQLAMVASDGGTPAMTQDVTNLATYVSSDPTKATVSATGLVTAVAVGSSTITATYEGVTKTVAVTVTA